MRNKREMTINYTLDDNNIILRACRNENGIKYETQRYLITMKEKRKKNIHYLN